MMKITTKTIETLPPGVHRISDSLYLRVYAAEKKRSPSWLFVYYLDGKRFELGLGVFPKVSISAAKERAAANRAMVLEGVNPKDAKKERADARAKAREEEEALRTFGSFAAPAIMQILEAKKCRNAKHRAQWSATVNTYAVPVLGRLPVRDITRDDILRVLRPIWYEKTETASRLRGRLEAIFDLAIATGLRSDANPCSWRGNLALFLPTPGRVSAGAHHAALSVEEARQLVARWKDNPRRSITASAILFGMLTCARVGEFVPARWEEIDFESAVWSCPAARRKDGKPYPHRVPLSRQALAVLADISRNGEYVFSLDGQGHISKESPRLIIQKIMGGGTMHGFRSTFRDWAAENLKDRVLSEKCLMHATGTEVEQAYQRSDLLEQRRPLMQEWADVLFAE